MAGRAPRLVKESPHAPHAPLVLHLGQRVLHGVHRAVVGEIHLGGHVGLLVDVEDVPLLGRAVEHDLPLLSRQLPERDIRTHAHLPGDVLHERPHQGLPGRDRALVDGERLVGHQGRFVDRPHRTRALAARAGAVGVEGEGLRARLGELDPAGGAVQGDVEGDVDGGLVAVSVGAHVVAQARVGQAQGVEHLGGGAEGGAHPGHGRALVQSQGGGHVHDLVDVGAGRLGQAPTRVGGQRLQIAAGALGVEHPKGQGGLARAGHAGDGHQPPQRHLDVDALEIVHACAAHTDRGGSGVRHGASFRAVAGWMGG